MPDQIQCGAGAAASGLALGLHGVEPREELGGGMGSTSVGTGRGHALQGRVAVSHPTRDERHVSDDRGTEQRVVRLACRLQCQEQGVVRPAGLTEIEELDPTGEEICLRQCGRDLAVRRVRRLREQGATERGVGEDGRVQPGRCDGPVEASVGAGDGLEVRCHGGWLWCGDGSPR